jgi:uncharacterized membrane protein
MGNSDLREHKRARFSAGAAQHKFLVPVIAGVAVVLVVAAVALWPRPAVGGRAAQAASGTAESVAVQDGVVRLPLATFDDGQARFYTYRTGDGVTIQYFAVRDGDGVVRAAFDACDVCYPAHKGFHQEGDEMVCNNCGRRFSITVIGQVSGGCNPGPLASSVESGDLVISVNDLGAGVGYFQ